MQSLNEIEVGLYAYIASRRDEAEWFVDLQTVRRQLEWDDSISLLAAFLNDLRDRKLITVRQQEVAGERETLLSFAFKSAFSRFSSLSFAHPFQLSITLDGVRRWEELGKAPTVQSSQGSFGVQEPKPTKAFDVFISFSSEDGEEANQLYQSIVAAGGRAFLSMKQISPGHDFSEEIRAALRSSGELWLLVSPNSLKKEWVLTEWGAAWVLKKKIIPILHRCAPDSLPLRLRSLQAVDFYKHSKLVEETFKANLH
jgi:hypothetical protein